MKASFALSTCRFTSLRWPENERYYTACKCLFDQLSILTELRLLIINREFNCCFLSLFYFLGIISAFVANIMSFIEALFRLRIWLFRYAYVFCRRESNKNWYCSTVLTPLLLTMVSVNHIYCKQIARFHCVCLSHRGCLIWVKFVKLPKQTFKKPT